MPRGRQVRKLLFTVTALMLMLVIEQAMTIRKQRTAIASLVQTQDASKAPLIVSLDLQSQCAQQAKQEFKDSGWSKDQAASFESHYNAKLGRCFIKVYDTTTENDVISTSVSVSDAVEGRGYGNYLWINAQHRKSWEVAPTECKVSLPSREEKRCQSSDEFDELAKIYME